MVKYRGKVGGRSRGQYKSCTLEALLEVPRFEYDEPGEFFMQNVDPYLSRAGQRLFVVEGDTVDGFYHFGGASLYARYSHNWERVDGDDRVLSLLQFVLCTNDSLGDVVDTLRRRFPFLSEPKERSDFW